ncbi:MAG TPA: Na+/H+ antiporter NhaA [Caulobacteraceae bacterium]|nr:Na+/H+ antiporter NhaA [Caulobacteraceae bacterium]
MSAESAEQRRLLRPVDKRRDHVRGGSVTRGRATVLIYGDYLCPYCRRLRTVLDRLRKSLGERMIYVFRHMPNERVHPGAEFASIASEAGARQGKFWDMHDGLFGHEPPLDEAVVRRIATDAGLDMRRFERDVADPKLKQRVDEDLADGRANGVTATPTIFIDGVRYDGAWDFYSMLEALERPVGARVQRTARAFANLPASAGIALLIAAAAALICANTPIAPLYQRFVDAQLGIGPQHGGIWLSVADWCSEGLLAIFFLIVGLEIRREMGGGGSLSDPRAAATPALAALGGVLVPAVIYLALNPGQTAAGWSAPADTGIAFTLAILAVFGQRVSAGLKVFIAAYAVADDILAILILAIFYPRELHPVWLIGAGAAAALMFLMSRWRIYAGWPYRLAAVALWLALHQAGVSGALAGIVLAFSLPTRPMPSAGPLLAQAATALAELEHAERAVRRAGGELASIEQEPIWDWASRNLSAAAARLLSPAERVERDLAPWSTYFVLPMFAFTAAGVPLAADLSQPDAWRVMAGVVLGLAIGKPIGIIAATWGAVKARIGIAPDASAAAFVGAAFLCGIGDPLSILLVEQAFAGSGLAAVAKLGVLVGSVAATGLGVLALSLTRAPVTPAEHAGEQAEAAGAAA